MRAGHLRSRAEFYRPNTTRNTRGATEATHALLGRGWVGIGLPSRRLANYGAGELPAGTMELSAYAGSPLHARDLVKVIAGPEAGTVWRVETTFRPGDGGLIGTVVPHNDPIEVA